jgi:outer membrane protein W
MRRILMLTLVTCLLAAPAHAGGFALFGSWAEANARSEAGGFGGRVEIGDTWSLDLAVTWYGEVKAPPTNTGIAVDEFRMLPVDLGVGYRFKVAGSVTPFVGAGVSLFFLDAEPVGINNEVGWYARAGLDLHISSNFYLLGELLWREAEAEYRFNDGATELRSPVDVGGWGVNLGVVWRF